MNRSFPERIKRILIAQSWNKRLDLIHRLNRIAIELNSVLHVKAFERRSINGTQPIPSRLHRIKPHISMNEPTPQLRSNCCRHTTPAKEISDKHTLVRRCLDNALQQSLRLLSGVINRLLLVSWLQHWDTPHIINNSFR